MKPRKSYTDSTPRPGKSPPPVTAAGNTRSFDMRPKPAERRYADPRDRAIRPTDATPERLLDEPGE